MEAGWSPFQSSPRGQHTISDKQKNSIQTNNPPTEMNIEIKERMPFKCPPPERASSRILGSCLPSPPAVPRATPINCCRSFLAPIPDVILHGENYKFNVHYQFIVTATFFFLLLLLSSPPLKWWWIIWWGPSTFFSLFFSPSLLDPRLCSRHATDWPEDEMHFLCKSLSVSC